MNPPSPLHALAEAFIRDDADQIDRATRALIREQLCLQEGEPAPELCLTVETSSWEAIPTGEPTIPRKRPGLLGSRMEPEPGWVVVTHTSPSGETREANVMRVDSLEGKHDRFLQSCIRLKDGDAHKLRYQVLTGGVAANLAFYGGMIPEARKRLGIEGPEYLRKDS